MTVLVVVGCSAPADEAGVLSRGDSGCSGLKSGHGNSTDDVNADGLFSQKLEIPPQLIPNGSSVTISGFPVAELESVSDHHKILHESVLLVDTDGAYGTAWLVRPNLVFTVEHGIPLLSNPDNVRLLTHDGVPVTGRVVAQSTAYDLALIELEDEVGAAPLELSQGSAARGEPVFSIGNPAMYAGGYSEAWITTVGVMAGFQEGQTSFIRTTIPTLGGQSGSPIFDLRGNVVGINGFCQYPSSRAGESLRAESSDQISYIPPRGACGGADVAVLKWFLAQYDAGLQVDTMPGWPDSRPEEYDSLADEGMPDHFVDESSGSTVSGFSLEDLELVECRYEELRYSIVMMHVGDEGSRSGGTGWLVAPDLVFTNEHVLPGREEGLPIRVETYDGSLIDATEVARDSEMDLALVRLSRPMDAEPLKISTNPVSIGAGIFSIGHPGSLPRTWVTSVGVVASREEPNLLFSSIPIAEGQSGSPVFDLEGEVIGILFGTRGLPLGSEISTASPGLQLSYHPPLPETVATPAREISGFLLKHLK